LAKELQNKRTFLQENQNNFSGFFQQENVFQDIVLGPVLASKEIKMENPTENVLD
jgi:hypothetical protein